MWPDRVSNPGPLTYESGALLTALRGPAYLRKSYLKLSALLTCLTLLHSERPKLSAIGLKD